VISDPEEPVDLTTLPIHEAVVLIEEIYGFLPSTATISLSEDIVTIDIVDVASYRANRARQTLERAVEYARRGRYEAAVRMLHDVLEVLPGNTEARRNLAMSYMEMGHNGDARRHIVEVLRLDPKDAWAFLILGNLCGRIEQDLESAERFYRRAYELDPDDAYLLNSYGAIKAKIGRLDEAQALFERAIKIEPRYPNPRYGLALVHQERDETAAVLGPLEGLFAVPESQDVRREPVYEQARKLYLDINRRLAQESEPETMERLREAMDAYTTQTGYPINTEEDNGLDVSAVAQLAWVHRRQQHLIKYKTAARGILPHRIAHEFMHIELADDARQASRGRVFISTTANREHALRDIRRSRRRFQRRGLADKAIDSLMDQMITGLANQLFNMPVDMVVEHRLHSEYDFLRPSQIISLDTTQLEALQAATDRSIRDMAPPSIYRASAAMNCAYALFTDFLFRDATAYAEPYGELPMFATGQTLFETWRDKAAHFGPGDEYDLVDEFAQILDLQDWYEWRQDIEQDPSQVTPGQPGAEGVTNVDLLREKDPAAIMYCLDALRRFEGMDEGDVLQITSEITFLGQSGLDYSSPERKYELHSLPDERFSGLQLMCLMYVGFQRIDPTVDVGMPLDDAYRAALGMHRAAG
jgi:Tfp pilus assembly protein PilF